MFAKINRPLRIIAYNIYIGTSAEQARRAIDRFKKGGDPELIGLMEATNLYDDLNGLGYEVVQLRPRSLRPGNRPGQGNIAILVRKDIPIVKRNAHHMKTFWRGPKHGWEQDPRVYRSVIIEHDGENWKIGCAHTPFGIAARLESARRLVRWLVNTIPGRPTVLVIDANMRRGDFKDDIAGPGEARVTGDGIDLAAYKHCRLVSEENLGRGVSDHPAMKYTFMSKRKIRRDP